MGEGSMLKSLAKGDIHAFEYLVDKYEKRIYGFVFNIIHNVQATEDLTQDIFIRIYKNLYKYNSEYPIEPWLFKIAYNIVLNYIKKNKYKLNEIPLQDSNYNEIHSEDSLSYFENRNVILNEIQLLNQECRIIFILRIFEDLSFQQIALILGKTEPSVKLKFYRNRKLIINKLRGEM